MNRKLETKTLPLRQQLAVKLQAVHRDPTVPRGDASLWRNDVTRNYIHHGSFALCCESTAIPPQSRRVTVALQAIYRTLYAY